MTTRTGGGQDEQKPPKSEGTPRQPTRPKMSQEERERLMREAAKKMPNRKPIPEDELDDYGFNER